MSEDDTEQFHGAELLGIKVTDTNRVKQDVDGWEDTILDQYGGDIMLIDIETDRGVLQFVAYNHHNGYYGHSAVVISSQLNYDTVL